MTNEFEVTKKIYDWMVQLISQKYHASHSTNRTSRKSNSCSDKTSKNIDYIDNHTLNIDYNDNHALNIDAEDKYENIALPKLPSEVSKYNDVLSVQLAQLLVAYKFKHWHAAKLIGLTYIFLLLEF